MAIFAEFAACKAGGALADSDEAQALIAKLQAHITENYYTCTDEILAGLGKTYVVDEQMEEEDNADSMINRYKLFGSDPKGLYALDQEYAGRVYTAPSLVL